GRREARVARDRQRFIDSGGSADDVMNLFIPRARLCPRRHFLQTCQAGVGAMALSQIMGRAANAAPETPAAENPLAPKHPQFPAKAKRIIYLEKAGAPPQPELFDYKPTLGKPNRPPRPHHPP